MIMNPYKLGDKVRHETDNCPFKVVGIRENSIEIQSDFSGGTHNVSQTDWVRLADVLPWDAWVDFEERQPWQNGFYLVFGDCTGSGLAQDIAEYDAGEGEFRKANQPTHWRFLPNRPLQA